MTGTLRVSADGEVAGLDLHEHGIVAYPEYVLQSPFGSPHAHAAESAAPVSALSPARAAAD
jgi:Amt family ammonium transporter